MSGIPTSAELIEQLGNQDQKLLKMGTVTDLFENGTAKIKFDGEDVASEKQYAYLLPYTPTVGDRVILAVISSSHIILGKVSYNATPITNAGQGSFSSIAVSGDASLKGNIGFFGTAPKSKFSVSSPSLLQTSETADSTYSSNEVNMLNHLKADVQNLSNTLNSIVNALKNYNLV